MLKQSLVQEKLSDLALAATLNEQKPVSPGKIKPAPLTTNATTTTSAAIIEISRNPNANTDGMLSHVPQWPRVQIGSSRHIIKTNNQQIIKLSNHELVQSPTASNTKIISLIHSGNNNSNNYDQNSPTEDYDGAETVNTYSNRFSNLNPHSNNNNNSTSSNNPFSNNSGHNSNNNNNHENLKNRMDGVNYGQGGNRNNLPSDEAESVDSNKDPSAYDPNLKLKYLEKSIRFIQQQHNETLNGLHQEIEKLKIENRELHFKLATRKSSGGSFKSNNPSNELPQSTALKNEDKHELGNPKSHFDKALKEASKETNLDRRLSDLKKMYETNKYDELYTRLKDAESKNEYLANIITQLQSKRSANSGYRPNINVNNNPNNSNNSNITTSSNNTSNNNSTMNSNRSNYQQSSVGGSGTLKLTINQIYSVEPLRIKLNESDEPRAPSLDESEVLIKKLFELYKQQKQQISNMKVVLKDMIQNENLSNQAIVMTKDVLENPNKLTHFLIDNPNMQKVSILTTFAPPKSSNSNGRLNVKYHSQLLNTLNNSSHNEIIQPLGNHQANSSLNISSIVHLPPLQTINPVRFPERQRRTQLLQRQRLRREFFH